MVALTVRFSVCRFGRLDMNVMPKGPFYRDHWIPISFVLTMVVVMLLALFMTPSTKTRLTWVKPGQSRLAVARCSACPIVRPNS